MLGLVVVVSIGFAYAQFGPDSGQTNAPPTQANLASTGSTDSETASQIAANRTAVDLIEPAEGTIFELAELVRMAWCWPELLRSDEQFGAFLRSESQEIELSQEPERVNASCFQLAVIGRDMIDLPGEYDLQVKVRNLSSGAVVAMSEQHSIRLIPDPPPGTPSSIEEPTATWVFPTLTPTDEPTLTPTDEPTSTPTDEPTPTSTPTPTPTLTPTPTRVPPTFTPVPTDTPLPPPPTDPPPPPPTNPPPPPPTNPPPPKPTSTAPPPPKPTPTPP